MGHPGVTGRTYTSSPVTDNPVLRCPPVNFDSYLLSRRLPGGAGFKCEFCGTQYVKLRGLRRHLIRCPSVSGPVLQMATTEAGAKKCAKRRRFKKVFGVWDGDHRYRSSALNAPDCYPDDN